MTKYKLEIIDTESVGIVCTTSIFQSEELCLKISQSNFCHEKYILSY